jgi:hypothetical protein
VKAKLVDVVLDEESVVSVSVVPVVMVVSVRVVTVVCEVVDWVEDVVLLLDVDDDEVVVVVDTDRYTDEAKEGISPNIGANEILFNASTLLETASGLTPASSTWTSRVLDALLTARADGHFKQVTSSPSSAGTKTTSNTSPVVKSVLAISRLTTDCLNSSPGPD